MHIYMYICMCVYACICIHVQYTHVFNYKYMCVCYVYIYIPYILCIHMVKPLSYPLLATQTLQAFTLALLKLMTPAIAQAALCSVTWFTFSLLSSCPMRYSHLAQRAHFSCHLLLKAFPDLNWPLPPLCPNVPSIVISVTPPCKFVICLHLPPKF